MSLGGLLLFLLIGLVAGWIAAKLMRGGSLGLVGNLVVGVIGAMIGGHILRFVGFGTTAGLVGDLITAIVGSVILLLVVGVLKRA